MTFTKTAKGFSTLIVVIVISAVALMVALTATLRSLDEVKTGLVYELSKNTFAGAEACLEEALLKLRKNNNYIGESLLLSDITCTISIQSDQGNRTLQVTAVKNNDYVRKLRAFVQVSPTWQFFSSEEIE